MTANRLITLTNLSFPDGRIRECWDRQNQLARFNPDDDDALAFFIASAVEDHYNDRLTSEEQIDDLIDEIKRAQVIFARMITTLKGERNAIKRRHARIGEEHRDEQ